VGQAQSLPGGPGSGAQHQKFGVKQIVPGVWGGTCAAEGPISPATSSDTANQPISNKRETIPMRRSSVLREVISVAIYYLIGEILAYGCIMIQIS
jgi:hypothetical protein